MKKMLLLNGSFNEINVIHTAHKMGYYVITTGNDSAGEGHKYANQYCPCDYSDKEAIYELAKKEQVDVICSCSNDFGALSAAYASEKLGIPGHDKYEISRFFHEKDYFKRMAKEFDLTTPEANWFDSQEKAISYIESMSSFPQIIKPADLSGGKGIRKVWNSAEAVEAVKNSFQRSKVKRVLIEDYIEGQQQGITTFIQNGKVVLDYTTNDYSYVNPYMVWMACSPAEGYDIYRPYLIADIEKMAQEKKLVDGFLTIQFILKNGKPYYLETMRRCLGNQHYLCMSKDTGVDFYELYVRSQCGQNCKELLNRYHNRTHDSGFMAVFAPMNGVIKSITIDSLFQEKLFDIKMINGPGYRVTDYLNDKIGILYFSIENKDRKWFRENMRNLFRVEMER